MGLKFGFKFKSMILKLAVTRSQKDLDTQFLLPEGFKFFAGLTVSNVNVFSRTLAGGSRPVTIAEGSLLAVAAIGAVGLEIIIKV